MLTYDLHVHISRENGAAIGPPFIQNIEKNLLLYKNSGITRIRDGGDREAFSVIARNLAKPLGLEFLTPVRALVKSPGYGAFLGNPVSSFSELKQELEDIRKQKPDFFKVIQSGIVSFDKYGVISKGGFKKDELRYIIDYAHDMGKRVMLHCNGAENIETALSLGADSIEHGYFIEKDQLQIMKEQNAVFVPTLIPLFAYAQNPKASETQKAVIDRTLKRHAESLLFARDIGVIVAVGSDSGAFGLKHTQSAFDELRLLKECGLGEQRLLSDTQTVWGIFARCGRQPASL